MVGPRERMVASAALLIRERGAHATAISDVLEHSGAPRGSAYHHFPGGRAQLLCEAVDLASEYVAGLIGQHGGGVDALDALIGVYRKQLIDSDFRAGCPVVAVAVEAGNPNGAADNTPLIERAAQAFERWTGLIAERLAADGVPAPQAGELAMLATTALEGAIVIARSRHDAAPVDIVHRQLRALIETAIQEANDDR